MTALQAGRPGNCGSILDTDRRFVSSPESPELLSLSPPVSQASGTLSSETKQLGREAGHCGAVPRFTNEWSYVSAAPPTGRALHCVVGIVMCSLVV